MNQPSKTEDFWLSHVRLPVSAVGLRTPLDGDWRPLFVTDWNSSCYKTETDRYSVGTFAYIILQRPRIPVVIHLKWLHLLTQVRPAITLFTQLEHPDLSRVNMQQNS